MITPQSFVFAIGVVNLVLAHMLWMVLRHRHHPLRVICWSLGAWAAGAWMLLLALRDLLPGWVSYELANALAFSSILLRQISLRLECGLPPRWAQHALAGAVAMLAYTACAATPGLRTAVVLTVHLLVGGGLCVYAWRAANVMHSPTGHLLARVEAGWVLILALRLLSLALGVDVGLPFFNVQGLDNGVLVMAALVLALFGNVAYLGMVLDHSQARERDARAAQLIEEAQRRQAEASRRVLEAGSQQRDLLFRQRERLLSVLAHEIRQPLHSASGAVQAAEVALQGLPAQGDRALATVTERLGNAREVLGELRSVLDNTLAASDVLTRQTPVVRQEEDIGWLIRLAIADLPPAQQALIDVVSRTPLRSLEVEPDLIRLAIRNLIRNAFTHGLGVQGRVGVVIEEPEAQDALWVRVVDHGPGMSEARCQALEVQSREEPEASPGERQRLGLVLVQRIMAMHGGRLELRPARAPSRGLVATLVFPLIDGGEPELTAVAGAP